MEFIATLFLVGMLLSVLGFMAYSLGMVTTIESENIKFAMRNQSHHRTMHNVKNRHLEEDGKFIDKKNSVASNARKTFLDMFLNPIGIWVIGQPLISSVHKFPIRKARINPKGHSAEDWIDKDTKPTYVDSLRHIIQYPYAMKNVELSDGFEVNILARLTFRVVDPYIPVFVYKGDFLDPASMEVEGPVGDIVNDIDLKTFRDAPKGEIDGILSSLMLANSPANLVLIDKLGLELIAISIPDWEGGNEATKKALVNVSSATVEAEAYAKAVKIQTEADVARIRKIASANRFEIKSAKEALAVDGVDPDVLVREVGRIIRTDDIANSNITTFVEGGSAPTSIALPAGQPKKNSNQNNQKNHGKRGRK